ncbi:MAG: hypothetical protein ACTTJK_09040 [Phocaeicola sp.]|uniref:hypothetical protein n=1 Tax=Phocaeicola sp. TaxID=2773926 RepID=UPI003FA02E06
MNSTEQNLNLFTTRMRQMILKYNETVSENKELYAMVEEQEQRIKDLKDQLARAHKDYDSLKLAKMLEVTDGDLETAKKRVAKIIRDVNKCITLLSEK